MKNNVKMFYSCVCVCVRQELKGKSNLSVLVLKSSPNKSGSLQDEEQDGRGAEGEDRNKRTALETSVATSSENIP